MFSSTLLCISLLLFHCSTALARVERGIAWAADNRIAPALATKPQVTWYYRQFSPSSYPNLLTAFLPVDWADPVVPQMGSLEYVPMFWGPKSWAKWTLRKVEMTLIPPKHLLAFNEPDVPSQANMDPNYAVTLYMQEIMPWSYRGTSLGSPAIAWNLDWLAQFLDGVRKKGGHVDFIVLHWFVLFIPEILVIHDTSGSHSPIDRYGSWKDLSKFKEYVQSAHQRFGKPIWVTELGITSASKPSQAQVKTFMMNAFAWMDSQQYIERAAWFGCFTHPPDGYATGLNALFSSDGGLSDLGYWLVSCSSCVRASLMSPQVRLHRQR
jgi:hypothetical protein